MIETMAGDNAAEPSDSDRKSGSVVSIFTREKPGLAHEMLSMPEAKEMAYTLIRLGFRYDKSEKPSESVQTHKFTRGGHLFALHALPGEKKCAWEKLDPKSGKRLAFGYSNKTLTILGEGL